MAIWLGITDVGGVVSLAHTHLSLLMAHCNQLVEPRPFMWLAELKSSADPPPASPGGAAKLWVPRRSADGFRAHRSGYREGTRVHR